jgi:hypothetical protein
MSKAYLSFSSRTPGAGHRSRTVPDYRFGASWRADYSITEVPTFSLKRTAKWSAQMNGPDGGGMTMTFNFKQDGTKLTGTIDGPGGEPMAIQDGKVDGEKIVFAVSFNDMKIVHEGTIKGDEITLTIQMNGGPGGGPGPLKLKRVSS